MTRMRLDELPARLAEAAPLVSVVGDLILDGWWHGDVRRMSREAPVPVVEIDERRYSAGGAANTAVNLAAMGARVRLVSVVGDDDDGRELLAILDGYGVDTTRVLVDRRVHTSAKRRISGADQVIVRVDDPPSAVFPDDLLDALVDAASEAADGVSAEMICDYGSALLGSRVRAGLAARAGRATLLVVDAHDPRRWAPLHPDVVTPNSDEQLRMLGADGWPSDRPAEVARRADELRAAAGAGVVVATLDREGTLTLRADLPPHRTHARPALESQSSGAGDTFAAALTLALAGGAAVEPSADFAQIAADIVVQRSGTSVCSTSDLSARLSEPPALMLDAEELAARLADDVGAGRRIVFTNGCFDVLHRGHTSYLHQASRLGDVLVVALNGDESVRRLKGPDRPVNTAADRAAVLSALGCVDYVTVFDSDTPVPLLTRLRPDVYAKGGDYTPEMLEEATVVEGYGGEVRMLDYVPSQSTTSMVRRIRESGPPHADDHRTRA